MIADILVNGNMGLENQHYFALRWKDGNRLRKV